MAIIEILCAIPLFGAVYFIFTYVHHLVNLRKYPKGPFPLPIIGNLHLLSDKPFLDFARLSKTYGDVFSISLGMQRVVIVHTIEKAREALVKKGSDFSGRPLTNYPLELFSKGFRDIAFSDYNKEWSFLRKVAHKSMHLYGDGIKRFEERIIEETECLATRLKEENEGAVTIQNCLGVSITNTICHLVFGKRYDVHDQEFLEIMEFLELFFTGLNPSEPIVCMPWLKYLPPSENLKRVKEGIKIRDRILHQEITRHKKEFDPKRINDITDGLLLQSQEEEISDIQLEMIVSDMLAASIETTLTGLGWAYLFLLHYPECQSKIYQEIVTILGSKRNVVLDDIELLPYLQAFIQESLRHSPVSPLNIPHKATSNSSIDGISIPKDCQIFFNIHQIHHDERHWSEPHLFKPERWLTPEGTLLSGQDLSFMPFSIGPRNCFGEKLARAEMFLMISRMVAQFEVKPDPDCPLPAITEGICGLAYKPPKYQAVFKVRKQVY